jgi:protein SCO1/2/putative membrane protein
MSDRLRPASRAGLVRAAAVASLLLGCASCQPQLDDDSGPVGDFTLTERDGHTVTAAELRGKVWIASFVFTRCMRGCPSVSKSMQRLQTDLRDQKDVQLVTFTVDPDHDTPDELKRYADQYGADPKRWWFLWGKEDYVYRLLREGFHVSASQNTGAERTGGNEVSHDTHLVIVDKHGHVRGYYPGLSDQVVSEAEYESGLRKLRKLATALAEEDRGIAALRPLDFPAVNASLNAIAGALIVFGFGAVRAGRYRLHAGVMLSALAVSAIFLTSYLYFHIVIRHGQPTHFEDQAVSPPSWAKPTYLAILLSHTILAVIVAPLALYTAYQGLRGRIVRHRAVARWTLPLWFYVSGTGVLVYWMLYRLFV